LIGLVAGYRLFKPKKPRPDFLPTYEPEGKWHKRTHYPSLGQASPLFSSWERNYGRAHAPCLNPSAGTLASWLIPSSHVLLSRIRPAASPSPFGDHVLHCKGTYLAGRVHKCQLGSQRPQWEPISAPDA